MAEKVVLSPSAKIKLSNLLEYLENGWSKRIKKEFIKKLDRSLLKISKYPNSCPESKEISGLFKCVVTKQTSLFYRIRPKEIQIVPIFATRQNPRKLKRQIR